MPISATGISTRRLGDRNRRAEAFPRRRQRVANAALGGALGRFGSRDRRRRCAGFSLLELLVVVMIIALFAGAAVLSIGTLGSDREVQREAQRLGSLIDLLGEEAVMASRDYGILFSESGYRFYVYDYQTLTWNLPAGDRLLAEHELTAPLQLMLELDDRAVELGRSFETMNGNEQPEPQVVVFASGEVTPFAARFYRDITGGRFSVEVDFDGVTTISEDGFDAS